MNVNDSVRQTDDQHGREFYELLANGSICIASCNSSELDDTKELNFIEGDALVLVTHSVKTGRCVVIAPNGTEGEIPLTCLKPRPPITSYPLLYLHKNKTIQEANSLLTSDGQFIVIPYDNGGYCICVKLLEDVKSYIVSAEADYQLTIDGVDCFSSLHALVTFYQDPDNVSNTKLVPLLKKPLITQEDTAVHVDREAFIQYWAVPSETIKKDKMIGKGEFGDVFSGDYHGNFQVAIKTISSSTTNDNPQVPASNQDSLLKEASIMTHLRHKNLVQLVGVVFNGPRLQLIAMELMSRGSLGKYLATRGRSVISQKEQIQYARDVSEGMVYLSSHGFVHRDLAARNVLLNTNSIAKVSDFGLSRKIDDIHTANEGRFPVKWTAPEALKERIFSEKSDVWSFGILLWEIFSFGRVPYPSIYADEVLEQLEDGYMMDPPEGCPDGIYDVMTECWCLEPNGRPPFKVIRTLLGQSFGESRTPCSSPQPIRTAFIKTKNEAEKLLNSPVASSIYKSAPEGYICNLKTANILAVGSKGAGKTSLIRNIIGEQFRQAEPTTEELVFFDKFHEALDYKPWRESQNALSYENELARYIAYRLLEHAKTTQSPPPPTVAIHSACPPLPELPPVIPPIINRRRSASFTHRPAIPQRNTHHMSMLVEDLSYIPTGTVSSSFSGSQPDDLNRTPPTSPSRKQSLKRKISFNLFRRSSNKQKLKSDRQTVSASLLTTKSSNVMPKRLSPLLSSRFDHSSLPPLDTRRPTNDTPPISPFSSPPDSPAYVSAIPDRLERKIKEKLNDFVSDDLPPEIYVRFIDTAGDGMVDTFPVSALFNSFSIALAVIDSSFDKMESIDELVAIVNAVFYRKSSDYFSAPTKPMVVLVGTHVEETTLEKANEFMNKTHTAIKKSGCGQYLSASYFLVSNSSIMSHSALDTLKSFILNHIKNMCTSHIPLGWLKSLSKVTSLSSHEKYIILQEEFMKIVSSSCKIHSLNDFIAFLSKNHLVLNFPEVPSLKNVIFTNAKWLVNKFNKLFCFCGSLADIPAQLSHDYNILVSQGTLTQALLDKIWPNCPKRQQEKLIHFLHQLELIALRSVDTSPISPWESQRSFSSLSSQHTGSPPSSPVISKIVIPCFLQEKMPQHIISKLTIFNGLETLYFKFSASYIPVDLFSKLTVRCIQSYNAGEWLIYEDGVCISVDESTTLLIYKSSTANVLRVNLCPSYDQVCATSLQMPTADIAMTTRMFLQASLSDLLANWTDRSISYDICIKCTSPHVTKEMMTASDESNGETALAAAEHFLVLNNIDNLFLEDELSLKCEKGHSINTLPDAINPWFGHNVSQSSWITGDNELINREDILSLKDQDISLDTLITDGNMTFLELISSLENLGKNELANSLIAKRLKTTGIAI